MKRLMNKLTTLVFLATITSGAIAQSANGDWPQWGRDGSKNMAAEATGLPAEVHAGKVKRDGSVDLRNAKNILWVAKLGSQTYGNPTVSNGRIFVGTNNQGRGDKRFKGDYSVLHCLDQATGKTLWSLTVPKLGTGKVSDWEFLGICSSPTVVDDRVYLVTNRCEVMCLDVNGFANGNQGLQDEGQYKSYRGTTPLPPVEVKKTDADIVWRYDMREELGVYPHNITSSAILVEGDILYCSTSNGVTYDHTDIPAPKAPALVALNRRLAEQPDAKPADLLVGEEGSGLSKGILHGNWTSPCWGEVNGEGVLLFGGPDGWAYAFDPNPVKDADGFGVLPEKWRYDCNPLEYRYKNGDKNKPIKYATFNGPSEVLATVVFYNGRLYTAIGQDPEHGEGLGNFVCIDVATGKKLWDRRIQRSLSTCSIVDDLVYVSDHSGYVYCMDANTGKLHWRYDTMSLIWGSTLVADGKLYVGNEDGLFTVITCSAMKRLADEHGAPIEVESKRKKLVIRTADKKKVEIEGDEVKKYLHQSDFGAAIYLSPITANGVLYVGTMTHLYAIKAGANGGD